MNMIQLASRVSSRSTIDNLLYQPGECTLVMKQRDGVWCPEINRRGFQRSDELYVKDLRISLVQSLAKIIPLLLLVLVLLVDLEIVN